jgi:hypothetical protein
MYQRRMKQAEVADVAGQEFRLILAGRHVAGTMVTTRKFVSPVPIILGVFFSH